MWKVFIMFSLVPLFVVVLRLRGDLISLECPARSTLVKKASRANPTTNKSLSIATVHLHISKRRHVRRRRLKSHWNFRFINLFNHRSFSQSEFRKVSRIHSRPSPLAVLSTSLIGKPALPSTFHPSLPSYSRPDPSQACPAAGDLKSRSQASWPSHARGACTVLEMLGHSPIAYIPPSCRSPPHPRFFTLTLTSTYLLPCTSLLTRLLPRSTLPTHCIRPV